MDGFVLTVFEYKRTFGGGHSTLGPFIVRKSGVDYGEGGGLLSGSPYYLTNYCYRLLGVLDGTLVASC